MAKKKVLGLVTILLTSYSNEVITRTERKRVIVITRIKTEG